MKKLVAISVLFAGLATAVFAQSGGWSNEWKVGLSATFITDMFYAASVTGKRDTTQTTTVTPSTTSNSYAALDVDATTSTEWGKNAKGVSAFFPNARYLPDNVGGDNRLALQLSNSGENYAIRVNIDYDDWATKIGNSGLTVGQFLLNGESKTDWGIKGNAGIFDVGLGPWAVEAAWVGTNATWGSWISWTDLNRFGIATKKDGWIHTNHFRTHSGTENQWGWPFAVGMKLGDSFKVTLGYRIDKWTLPDGFQNPGNEAAQNSRSSMNGTFMLSGSPVDLINFDLFYHVQGTDMNTFSRPVTELGLNTPEAYWTNIIGAYVQVNGLDNLFVSGGYTVKFNAYEAGSWVDPKTGDLTASKPVTFNAPINSSVDLRLGFSGIDRIGLKFNNNVSFATVNGEKYDPDKYNEKLTLDIEESGIAGAGVNVGYFHWHSILTADLGFIDGVGLEVALGNKLDVTTTSTDKLVNVPGSIAGSNTSYATKGSNTDTTNVFRASVGAKYGIGNVSLGVALFLEWTSTLTDFEETLTVTSTGGGSSRSVSTKNTEKSNNDVVKFGIPVVFTVSF